MGVRFFSRSLSPPQFHSPKDISTAFQGSPSTHSSDHTAGTSIHKIFKKLKKQLKWLSGQNSKKTNTPLQQRCDILYTCAHTPKPFSQRWYFHDAINIETPGCAHLLPNLSWVQYFQMEFSSRLP
eukprot:TRINITY_DN928_c0_g3_i1.p2 TRINITY_DN928_c0_g3~~TRINITY_DN928_c0_g3_i1.p2  ORF type:complete len:125 (+),score=7.71 TRINITY_DN928_c0_g3_i1:687-1061(+)